MSKSEALLRPYQVVRMLGARGTASAAADRVFRRRTAIAATVLAEVHGLHGLEVGGPSANFAARGPLPIYPAVAAMDNVNFATHTLWEADLSGTSQFAPGGRSLGRQLIMEAGSLALPDASYDFVASSHALEHCANPIGVLREWHRVTRPGGHLVLVLPHYQGTFDHTRPVTTLEHMRADWQAGVGEDDPTHHEEFVTRIDLRRAPGQTRETLRARTADNLSNRGVHHHVFDTASALRLLKETGWGPVAAQARRPWDIFVLARRLDPGGAMPTVRVERSDFSWDSTCAAAGVPAPQGPPVS